MLATESLVPSRSALAALEPKTTCGGSSAMALKKE
jgi:hypothetical protein